MLREGLKICHESQYEDINKAIQDAKNGKGNTMFEEIIDVIQAKNTGHDRIQ